MVRSNLKAFTNPYRLPWLTFFSATFGFHYAWCIRLIKVETFDCQVLLIVYDLCNEPLLRQNLTSWFYILV